MTKFKKILITAISAISAACAVSALTACGGAHEHSFGEWSDLVNTCTDHVQVRVCSECGLKETNALQASGHSYGEWKDVVNSCDKHVEYRTCTKCDAEEMNELETDGHNYGSPTIVKSDCFEKILQYECGDCGDIKKEIEVYSEPHHLFGEFEPLSDHVQTRVCSECGWKRYEATAHQFDLTEDVVNTCTQHIVLQTCSICGLSQTEELTASGHHFVNGKCVDCGAIGYNGEALDWLDKYNGTYGLNYFKSNEMYAQQALYKKIDEQARLFHVNTDLNATRNTQSITAGPFYEAFTIDFSDLGLTSAQATAVWKTFRDDNPLYYWLSGSVSITSDGTKLIAKCYDDYAQGSARKTANELIYRKLDEYLSILSEDDNGYMTALAFHDAIINAIDYAYKADGTTPSDEAWAHNILGLFNEDEKKGGTCETYSRAFQLLLNYAGIENVFVTGTAGGGAHSWNLVKLDDGNWYWCDLTWDDTPDITYGVSYDYFMVNDTQIIGTGAKIFPETHVHETPSGTGTSFLYDLPTRSPITYSNKDIAALYKTFNTTNAMYAVSGYNTVQLISFVAKGDIEIPEEVIYAGKTYTVISIGAFKDGKFVDGTVLRGEETSVKIPKTVKYIANGALDSVALQSITVDPENEYYTVVDGKIVSKK